MQEKVMVRVVKDGFSFEASHRLTENYEGPCNRWHGHSYKMSVAVEGYPNEAGFVVDFKRLKQVVNDTIIERVDHRCLNRAMPSEFSLHGNTTVEKMIIAFWWELDHEIQVEFPGVRLAELKLWETEHSHAVLTREMVYHAEK